MEEGTSRNVPIAGFEMILREDYKSRDEVEGLIIFPKYHFKPQDTWNIPWSSRQQSRHLLYCMAPHCLAQLLHNFSLSIFFISPAGIFFKLRAVQCVSCTMRAKTASARSRRSTYMFEAIVSQAHFAICLRERSGNIWWYRSMFLLRSSGEGNILKCLSITWLCLANRWLALGYKAIQYNEMVLNSYVCGLKL